MAWTRRDLLRAAGGLAAAASFPHVSACAGRPAPYVWEGAPSPIDRFLHGVASGDPLSDSVILWTHVTLDEGEGAVDVTLEVAEDEGFEKLVAVEVLTASAALGGCVKVDLGGLEPGGVWFYRFHVQDRTSPVGRTRTAPGAPKRRDPPQSLRFALVSCSNYGAGWFHAYRALAERDDLDLVLHAGDYIYEGSGGISGRSVQPPREILTLEDYRARYAHYRTDPDLAALHARHPVVATWDDHESANDAYRGGAQNHDPASEGPWADRLDAARQAWFEWLPAREGEAGRLYRQLRWGDLAQIFVLDTRTEGRDAPSDDPEVINAASRQLLGEPQERWLLDGLSAADTTWKLLLQQVILSPWGREGPRPLNPDQWDGFPAARRRLLSHVADARIDGVVVLTGDIHSSWVFDVPTDIDDYDPDTGAGAVALELVTPAVTSSGLDLGGADGALRALMPHLHFVDLLRRGFVVVTLTPERVEGEWWLFEDGQTTSPDRAEPALAARFEADHGVNHWRDTLGG